MGGKNQYCVLFAAEQITLLQVFHFCLHFLSIRPFLPLLSRFFLLRKMANCLTRGKQIEKHLLCVRELTQVPASAEHPNKLFPWKLLALFLHVHFKEMIMLQTPLICLGSVFLLVL